MPPEKLQIALERLQGLKVDQRTKDTLGDVLRAAANPHAESIEVIIKSLPEARRKMIEKTARGLRALNADVMARGKGRIDGLSDDEWTSLIEQAD